jgi:hypothetical protein
MFAKAGLGFLEDVFGHRFGIVEHDVCGRMSFAGLQPGYSGSQGFLQIFAESLSGFAAFTANRDYF